MSFPLSFRSCNLALMSVDTAPLVSSPAYVTQVLQHTATLVSLVCCKSSLSILRAYYVTSGPINHFFPNQFLVFLQFHSCPQSLPLFSPFNLLFIQPDLYEIGFHIHTSPLGQILLHANFLHTLRLKFSYTPEVSVQF